MACDAAEDDDVAGFRSTMMRPALRMSVAAGR